MFIASRFAGLFRIGVRDRVDAFVATLFAGRIELGASFDIIDSSDLRFLDRVGAIVVV